MKNLLIGAIVLLLLTPVSAQKREAKITFAGNDAGFCRYELKRDGSFASSGMLQIANIKMESSASGKIKDGKLIEYKQVEKSQDGEATLTAKGKKLTIQVKGKKDATTRDYDAPAAYMANLHPWMVSSIIKQYDKQGPETQELDIFVTDGAVKTKVKLSRRPVKTFEGPKGRQTAEHYLARFSSGVEIDFYADEKGEVLAWDVPSQRVQYVFAGYEDLMVDPTTKFKELSQPQHPVKTETLVKVKMRDGVELAATVARPDSEGKFPAILVRTPYNRKMSALEGDWWAKRGFVYITQDVRGRDDSDGEWEPFLNEREDGYDTLNWIVAQPWCDGNIGMIGGSYLGFVQWQVAVTGHPALKAIIPQVSPPDLFFNIPWDHGVFMMYGAVWWANYVKGKSVPEGGPKLLSDKMDKFYTLPLSKLDDEMLEEDVPFYNKWLEMDRHSSFGKANFLDLMNKVKIPVLHISGWWDGDGIGTKLNWERLRSLGHKDQWVIYGPWSHAFNTSTQTGDVDYGPEAVLELNSVYLRFFDQYLKGKDVAWKEQPKARIFVTGANEWREFSDWPPGPQKTLYLSSDAPANGAKGQGRLVEAKPGNEEPNRYTYNPASATIPEELKEMEDYQTSTKLNLSKEKDDFLIFKTPVLEEDLEISGSAELELYFSSSAKDTDFFWVLADFDEKDEPRLIGLPGKISARFVSSWDEPKLIEPGKVYKAVIPHWDVAHRFKKGHRLGVVIMSDMFPVYARNLNTGEPLKDAVKMIAAHQTIYHDAERPSQIRFHLLPKR